jgi:hypothetical protein
MNTTGSGAGFWGERRHDRERHPQRRSGRIRVVLRHAQIAEPNAATKLGRHLDLRRQLGPLDGRPRRFLSGWGQLAGHGSPGRLL